MIGALSFHHKKISPNTGVNRINTPENKTQFRFPINQPFKDYYLKASNPVTSMPVISK